MVSLCALHYHTSISRSCLFLPVRMALCIALRSFVFGENVCHHCFLPSLFFTPGVKTGRVVQFLGAFTACSSAQRGPLWWAAHHRRHHRHSDTEKDMHSPKTNSLFWSHTLWFMTDYAVPTFLKEIPDWLKFPELRFINRYDWIQSCMMSPNRCCTVWCTTMPNT